MSTQGEFSNALLCEVRKSGQDFEWYPTTREIIRKVCRDLEGRSASLLDIGAGNGNVFSLMDEMIPGVVKQKYAIEKSELLINNMPSDVFIVGTDFQSQTLIDKEVDVVFCNPPYSEYEEWATKIIKEANCDTAYLVIPSRWKDSRDIQHAVKSRSAMTNVLGSFDFKNSEYRKARAKVDVVKVYYLSGGYNRDGSKDPFDVWFDEQFTFEADKDESSTYEEEEEQKVRIHALSSGNDLIERLAEIYQKDLQDLHDNYRAVEQLDAHILKELNVNVSGLKDGLRQKIKGAKNLYWHELFNNLSAITDRLASKSREKLLNKLTSHTSIDFTVKNAYAVIIWAIKNANKYIDEQLLDVYGSMTSKENLRGYKSNRRFQTDEWRYLNNWDVRNRIREGSVRDYKLDYRLVFEGYRNFCTDKYGFGSYDFPNGLRTESHTFLNDIFTIAKNLGFDVNETTRELGDWHPGVKKIFTYGRDGKTFAEIRAYKNGNTHAKFSQEFMMHLNVEAGRLNGWLRDPAHANDELGIKNAEKYFKSNLQLLPSEMPLLLPTEKKSA